MTPVMMFNHINKRTVRLRVKEIRINVLTEEEEAEQSVMDAHVEALMVSCCLSSLFTSLTEGVPPPTTTTHHSSFLHQSLRQLLTHLCVTLR